MEQHILCIYKINIVLNLKHGSISDDQIILEATNKPYAECNSLSYL